MTRKLLVLTGLLILIVFVHIGCGRISIKNENTPVISSMQIQSYTVPYQAPGKYDTLYKNIKEVNTFDETINNLIDSAKKIAKASGYAITGNNLDKYLYEGKEYEVTTFVSQNDEYYWISFVPSISDSGKSPSGGWRWRSVYCCDLHISFHKKTMEVVNIYQGS
jgi:hypothetical protein